MDVEVEADFIDGEGKKSVSVPTLTKATGTLLNRPGPGPGTVTTRLLLSSTWLSPGRGECLLDDDGGNDDDDGGDSNDSVRETVESGLAAVFRE